jgi:hypothetical protein
MTDQFVACGGWCKHGVMEASWCEECAKEWAAMGLTPEWHQGDLEAFRKAWEAIPGPK